MAKNSTFIGANLWILACAILIASIGLNVNSTAVIIGAMLISPLMGPIVASGFALGIYDFELLKKSLKNLFNATLVSLTVSTLYFFISPFKEAQSELLARTAPNIYDILIGFFGGLVGVIAVTRVEKGNPIPGVAIATALMPPLCTAGYGLATGNLSYFFGAFFLFMINCVFICLATYAIVKFMKFPVNTLLDKKREYQVRLGITIIVVCMIVPAVYFAYNLFNQHKFNNEVDAFVENEFTQKGYTVVYKKFNYNTKPKIIEVALLSKRFTPGEIDTLNAKLNVYNIYETKLRVRQDSTDKIEMLRRNILSEVNAKDLALLEKENEIKSLQGEIAKNTFDSKKILQEARTIFPTLEALSLSNNIFYFVNDSTSKSTLAVYDAKRDLANTDKKKLVDWLKQRLTINDIILLKR